MTKKDSVLMVCMLIMGSLLAVAMLAMFVYSYKSTGEFKPQFVVVALIDLCSVIYGIINYKKLKNNNKDL